MGTKLKKPTISRSKNPRLPANQIIAQIIAQIAQKNAVTNTVVYSVTVSTLGIKQRKP
jgi:hypothetical protein